MDQQATSLGVKGFFDRYPYFSFLMSIYSLKDVHFEEDVLYLANEIKDLHVSVLFVYGIGLGKCHDILKNWLDQDPLRQVVFLEHDFSVISKGALEGVLDQIFASERFHLCFSESKNDLAELAAIQFASHSIEVVCQKKYKEIDGAFFKRLKSNLMRLSVLSFAKVQEKMHYHHLFKNMVSNFASLEKAFNVHKMEGSFRNCAAFIVGAGPSLAQAIPKLKSFEEKALILAGGSSIIALAKSGIEADLGFAIDPNREEYTRLKQAHFLSMPLIFGSRLQKDAREIFAGAKGYVKTATGGPFEAWMEEVLNIEGNSLLGIEDYEALSVTIIAVKTALLLGANPIIFVGMDLAYQNKERYLPGILPKTTLALEKDIVDQRTSEASIRKKGRKGKFVETAYKWVMESRCLSNIAKMHPQTRFIDATEEGLLIKGIEMVSLDQIELSSSYPLKAKIHKEIEEAKLSLTKKQIYEPLERLKQSFENVKNCIEEILLDPLMPKSIVLELDIKSEIAYELILCHFDHHSPIISEEGKHIVNTYLETLCLQLMD